jgi:hypothetical protein
MFNHTRLLGMNAAELTYFARQSPAVSEIFRGVYSTSEAWRAPMFADPNKRNVYFFLDDNHFVCLFSSPTENFQAFIDPLNKSIEDRHSSVQQVCSIIAQCHLDELINLPFAVQGAEHSTSCAAFCLRIAAALNKTEPPITSLASVLNQIRFSVDVKLNEKQTRAWFFAAYRTAKQSDVQRVGKFLKFV